VLPKLNTYLFWGLVTILAVTFFSRNNIRSVSQCDPALFKQPLQSQVYGSSSIQFAQNGYQYTLTPRYNYDISALVVGAMNYRMFSINKFDLIFPVDLCLTWGSNVRRGLHRNSAVRFSQDCRWCWVNWSRDVQFNMDELSNNHLLVDNSTVLKDANSITRGDQVRIRGKLVDVRAKLLGKSLSPDVTWNTSISRADSGAGACEVIYVERLEILRRSNLVSKVLFRLSLYGLLGLVIWNSIVFFWPGLFVKQ
jgi:hypothetical protein